MNRARLVGISSVAVAVLAAAACGSAGSTGGSPTTAATAPVTKLDLASGGTAATPSAGAAIFPVRPTKYVLDAKLADLGTSAMVWRLHPHSVTVSDAQHFGDVFGLVGSPTHTSTGWQVQSTSAVLSFVVSDSDVTVSYAYGAPGAVGGSTGSAGSVGPAGTAIPPSTGTNAPSKVAPPAPSPVPTPPPLPTRVPVRTSTTAPAPPVDVPSAADATSIARALLRRLGVLAGQNWSTTVNDSGGIAVSCAVGTPCPPVPLGVSARTVTFSMMLDGTRVDGLDWSVTIGEHHRIESVNGEWVTPAAIGSYPLRSTAAVFADLQHGTAKYAGPQPLTAMSGARDVAAPTIATSRTSTTIPSVTVHVTGVWLGVARWDAYDRGQLVVDLVPTYRFHARVDSSSTYDVELLAVDPGAVTFR